MQVFILITFLNGTLFYAKGTVQRDGSGYKSDIYCYVPPLSNGGCGIKKICYLKASVQSSFEVFSA